MKYILYLLFFITAINCNSQTWSSKWVWIGDDGKLKYGTDLEGNTIPDFSRVGYREGELPPEVNATIEIEPIEGDNLQHIQDHIDILSEIEPNENGIRGCLLLKKGRYEVSDQITISSSGIVIRGEGNTEEGTIVVATGTKQYSLFKIIGSGSLIEVPFTNVKISMDFVPVGSKKLAVKNSSLFNIGDDIVVFRPGTEDWISDLKMNQIEERDDGGKITQWTASAYNLHYQRKIVEIIDDTLLIDQPIVMQMESKYGGGFVYKYAWKGRIRECGIENMLLKSDFISETDENHAWNAIKFESAKDCWVLNITAKYFGFSAVNVGSSARNITVLNCKCFEPKSEITGGRRYSFNCDGQLNLFKNCEASEGRHDFVTGSKVCGPNVFTQCVAKNTNSDIGPHHRWATGTLYDVVKSDGQINVQDRGNYGSGHGWAGANQVLWNCWGSMICVQNPWVSAKNYAIACSGVKWNGRYSNRPPGEWEGFNLGNVEITSLYEAQLLDRHFTPNTSSVRNMQKSNICSVVKLHENIKIEFNMEFESGNIEIYDLTGRLITTKLLDQNINIINLPYNQTGTYIYRIRSKNLVQNGKIVI